jgi:hypothetical protein
LKYDELGQTIFIRGDRRTVWRTLKIHKKLEELEFNIFGNFVSIDAAEACSSVQIGCVGLLNMLRTENMKEIGPEVTLRQPIDGFQVRAPRIQCTDLRRHGSPQAAG